MKSIKKRIFVVLLCASFLSFFGAQPVFSQMSVDPQDSFYSDAQVWFVKGLVKRLPPLRPYPVATIKDILTCVIEGSDAHEAAVARSYWERLTGKSWYAYLEAQNTYKNESAESSDLLGIYPGIRGDVSFFEDFVSMGYTFGLAGRTESDESAFLPMFVNSTHDARVDPSSVGIFNVYLDANDVVSIGTKNLYFQTGVYRSGYGDFIGNGLALNDSSVHKGNFSFTYMGERWAYSQQLSVIGATRNAYSSANASVTNNKYLAFHSLEFNIARNLSASYYETIVFGKRFDPIYFIPSPYMVSQGISGFNDNIQMGLRVDYSPMRSLILAADLFVDDLDVNRLVKFDADSKNRVGMTLGVVYAPEAEFCNRLDLNYSIITPYTYSHWEYEDDSERSMTASTYNYQNYTNNGVSIGTNLPPNSDAIRFDVKFRPLNILELNVFTLFARHGNVCESLTDEEALVYLLADANVYSTDGSAFTHSMQAGTSSAESLVSTAWNSVNFLTQSHKMYVVQAGLDADLTLRRYAWGRLSFCVNYVFEYVHNKNVDTNLYPGGRVTQNSDGTYSIDSIGSYTAAQTVAYFKDLWASSLVDAISNFIAVSICYEF